MNFCTFRRGFLYGGALLFIMVKFQNCAPQGVEPTTVTQSDGEMRVVDDWVDQKVNFVESLVVLHDQSEQAAVDGLCDRTAHGEKLDWRIQGQASEVNGGQIESGQSFCERGGFRLAFHEIQSLKCNQDYHLSVNDEEGGQDELILRRKCAPLSAIEVNEPGSVQQCYLELDQSPYSAGYECFETCYKSEKLYSRQVVKLDQCPTLSVSNH